MIRLIELFAGIGAQASALDRLGIPYEPWIISEWEINAVASYKAIHSTDNNDYSKGKTLDEITKFLIDKGISKDGKVPMTQEQINRLKESKKRQIYNNFISTHNVGSITNIKGAELQIIDTERFTYLLTYSFPCQDLSVAGKGKGMSKGMGTRSGLLWEVERLLDECKELPQILLMENVVQVHGKKNLADFEKWCTYLESKGYHNYYDDLNAKNYGVAQNRNRTFMISKLDSVPYKFPEKIPLTKKMKDYLDEIVEEKFYIENEKTRSLINKLEKDGILEQEGIDLTVKDPHVKEYANCIKARYDGGISNLKSDGTGVIIPVTLTENGLNMKNKLDVAHTLLARDYKGLNIYGSNGIIECKEVENNE